jgi:hypothetical protein
MLVSKPWYAEREFVIAVLALILGGAMLLRGETAAQSEAGTWLVSVAVGGYTVSRGLAKMRTKP